MNPTTYNSLTDKLKNMPQNILERVSGYVDALIDEEKNFELSDDQKRILDDQENLPIDQYADADELYNQLKIENGL